MSIIDRILTVLAPYECLGCAAEGTLLCSGCIQQLTAVSERCYKCRTVSLLSRTCSDCSLESRLRSVHVVAAYEGHAKALVAKLKFEGAQAAAVEMAALLGPLIPDGDMIIMPVPTATSRIRGRGYDQAKLLARALSRQTRLPYREFLVRHGQTHQIGATRAQRLRQLEQAFSVRNRDGLRGKNVLLVDDVLTTGATLESAAHVLHQQGAATATAAVFAEAQA